MTSTTAEQMQAILDKQRAAFTAALPLGCGKKEDPVKIIEEAEQALPAAEKMPVPAPGRWLE